MMKTGKPWSGKYWRVRPAGHDSDYWDLWHEWGGRRRWIGIYSTRQHAERGKAAMRARLQVAYARSPLDGAEELTAIMDRLGRWGDVQLSSTRCRCRSPPRPRRMRKTDHAPAGFRPGRNRPSRAERFRLGSVPAPAARLGSVAGLSDRPKTFSDRPDSG